MEAYKISGFYKKKKNKGQYEKYYASDIYLSL